MQLFGNDKPEINQDFIDDLNKNNDKIERKDNFRFWLIVILTLVTIIISSASLILQIKQTQTPHPPKQGKKLLIVKKDSLSNRNSLKK